MLTPKNRGEKHGATVMGRGGLLTPGSTPSSATDTEGSTSSSTSKTTPNDRKSGLYARLASKAATAGPKPSVEAANKEAEWSAALHFLPELVQTLALLSKGKRRSFGLGELVRTVKESSRGVVEDAVVKGALELLSGGEGEREGQSNDGEQEEEALAQEYVKVVRIGEKALGVVIDGRARPEDLDERIKKAIDRSRQATT